MPVVSCPGPPRWPRSRSHTAAAGGWRRDAARQGAGACAAACVPGGSCCCGGWRRCRPSRVARRPALGSCGGRRRGASCRLGRGGCRVGAVAGEARGARRPPPRAWGSCSRGGSLCLTLPSLASLAAGPARLSAAIPLVGAPRHTGEPAGGTACATSGREPVAAGLATAAAGLAAPAAARSAVPGGGAVAPPSTLAGLRPLVPPLRAARDAAAAASHSWPGRARVRLWLAVRRRRLQQRPPAPRAPQPAPLPPCGSPPPSHRSGEELRRGRRVGPRRSPLSSLPYAMSQGAQVVPVSRHGGVRATLVR